MSIPATEAHSEADRMLMSPAIARSWSLWAPIVGRTAVSRIEASCASLPEMTSAIVSTADGLHIGSVGLGADDADRLAALHSSLFGVAHAESRIVAAEAEVATVLDGPSEGRDARLFTTSVSLSVADTHTVVHGLVVPPFGQLLLGISARGVQMGTLMVTARRAAHQLAHALGESAPTL